MKSIFERLSDKLMDLGNLLLAGVIFGNVVAFKEDKLELWWIFGGFFAAFLLYVAAIWISREGA